MGTSGTWLQVRTLSSISSTTDGRHGRALRRRKGDMVALVCIDHIYVHPMQLSNDDNICLINLFVLQLVGETCLYFLVDMEAQPNMFRLSTLQPGSGRNTLICRISDTTLVALSFPVTREKFSSLAAGAAQQHTGTHIYWTSPQDATRMSPA